MMPLNTSQELIDDLRLGKMVVLLNDEEGTNGAALVLAAEKTHDQAINFMARKGRGLVCLTLTRQRCEQLKLPLMVQSTKGQHRTNFTLAIEAAEGVTTGISAGDRSRTIEVAVAPNAKPEDLVQPGHVFPLMAEDGGVLTRAGHTEAGCDLARMAGYEPAAVITDIINADGQMAGLEDLHAFAKEHQLKIGSIADLIHYRLMNEKTVEQIRHGSVKTEYGEFDLYVFEDLINRSIHLALVKGEITPERPALVRVQGPAVLRDVIGAQPPDADSWNMHRCLKKVAEEGCGVLVIIALAETREQVLNSVAIVLGDTPLPAPSGDSGQNIIYNVVGIGSQILHQLGVGKMRLMARPIKYNAIAGFDLEVTEYVQYPG